MSEVQIVGCDVDMLVLNVYYANSDVQPLKQELDGDLQHELEELQVVSHQDEIAVKTAWIIDEVPAPLHPNPDHANSQQD